MNPFIEFEKNKKALIKVGYSCNNNCLFCWTEQFGKENMIDLTKKQILSKILLAKKLNVDTIVLSGGEATIRKDIFSITSFIKKNNLKLGLGTNGRMLSSKIFFNKLIKFDLDFIQISFYSTNKTIHNKISKSDGFNQTIQGIKNSTHSKIKPIINVIVNPYNVNNLRLIVDFLYNLKVKYIKFSLVEPSGKAMINQEIIPEMSLAGNKVHDAIKYAETKKIITGFDGFPLCIVKENFEKSIHLKKIGIDFISEAFENKFYKTDLVKYIRINKCKSCKKKTKCLGIYQGYIDIIGINKINKIIEPY